MAGPELWRVCVRLYNSNAASPLSPRPPSSSLASVPDTALGLDSFHKPFLEPAFGTVLRRKCKTFPLFRFCLCFGGFALEFCHPSDLALLVRNSFLHVDYQVLTARARKYTKGILQRGSWSPAARGSCSRSKRLFFLHPSR